MIYLDRRQGSKELYLPLQAEHVPVELTDLEYGDACFIGEGPAGEILIGVERKRITDLIASFTTGRLSGHQLPGMVEHYAYRWLLVEGQYRRSHHGFLEVPRGPRWVEHRVQHAALEAYLLTLQLRGGIRLQRTFDLGDSAAWLATLYRWWTGKRWREHRSHLALQDVVDANVWNRPNLVHRMAAQLPGIDEKAVSVAQHFSTVAEMVEASEGAWRQISGIGKITAERVTRALRDPKA